MVGVLEVVEEEGVPEVVLVQEVLRSHLKAVITEVFIIRESIITIIQVIEVME